MTRKELKGNLGRIAQSGTKKFTEALGSGADATNLIGQFGVGFYSAFLVADRITVATKNNNDGKTWEWESDIGSSSYSIKEAAEPLVRGTRITLHLKEDAEEFAEDSRLQGLVKTYSEFISFPIEVYSKQSKPKQVVDDDATKEAKEAFDKKKIEAEAKGEEFTETAP